MPPKDPAESLADYLFTNGDGEEADRLALVQDFGGGVQRDLGGWCRQSVVDAIRKFFPTDQAPTE